MTTAEERPKWRAPQRTLIHQRKTVVRRDQRRYLNHFPSFELRADHFAFFMLQSTLSAAEFTSRALPLHVNITHTPPSITKEDDNDDNNSSGKEEEKAPEEGNVNVTASDVGFIGNLTLVPTSFSTGSYGWKGSKRITVELQGGDSDKEGHKEKVQVILSSVLFLQALYTLMSRLTAPYKLFRINATVLGSKPAKAEKSKRGKRAAEEEDEDEDQDEPQDEVTENEAL